MGFSTFIFILTLILSWASRKNWPVFLYHLYWPKIRDSTASYHLRKQIAILSKKRANMV